MEGNTTTTTPPAEWQTGLTTFDSFEDAFIQISSLSHSVRGNLKVARRNARCLHLICRDTNCPFNAYVSYDKKQASYILRQLNNIHTCIGVQQEARGSLHSSKYVEAKIRQGMAITRQTTPKQLMAYYQEHHGPIKYHTASRVLHSIRGDELEEQSHQFALLPSYAQQILQADPLATSKLKMVGNRFSSLFIAPSASTEAWPNLRPFVAVDAAFTKVIHDYVLLIATGLDGTGEALNLAWGIAPKENMDHWGWFFDNLVASLPSFNHHTTVVMSDRQKGLNRAVEIHLPNVTEAFCCKHIERNLTGEFGMEVVKVFWRAVYARTQEKFDEAMEAMRELNPRCHERLVAIPHKHWADYAFPAPRYGQHTSNLVEQQNWVYVQARDMPVLDIFTHIWKDMQGKLFKRLLAAQACLTPLSISATLLYCQAEDSARSFDVVSSSSTSGLVFLCQQDDIEFRVELYLGRGQEERQGRSTGSCTCGKFQNDRMPCAHALAFIHEQGLAPMQFIAMFYTKDAWLATYQQPLPTLLRSDLKLDNSVMPPLVKKRRGRPQKRRREQGQVGLSQAGRTGAEGQGSTAIASPPSITAAASPPSSAPVANQPRRQKQRFNPWVYVVDVPRLQEEIRSRTRSGAV